MALQIRRTPTPNNPPTGLLPGQLSVEMASTPPVLWAGVPTTIDPSGRVRIAPPNLSGYVSTTALTTALANYLLLAGDTMTGPLTLAGDATANLQPVTLQQLIAATSGNTGRNYIDNSLFNVWQRGIGPFTATPAGVYSADRWLVAATGTSTAAGSQYPLTDTHRTQIGSDFPQASYLINFTGNTGANNAVVLQQRSDRLRDTSGKLLTLSFFAMATTAGLRLAASLDQEFGTAGSPAGHGTGQSVALQANLFSRYSMQFSVPSVQGQTIDDTDAYLALNFWCAAGANAAARADSIGLQSGVIVLYGVQLEDGNVMTSLEIDPITQLAQCQRFYQWADVQLNMYGETTFAIILPFPQQMRTDPTITPNITVQLNCSGVTVGAMSPAAYQFTGTVTTPGVFNAFGQFWASADL